MGNLLFVLLGSATIQPWNAPSEENGMKVMCKYEDDCVDRFII